MIGTKQQVLLFLQDKDESTIFELKEYKQTRTQLQNNLYWGYLLLITKAFEDKGIFITSEDLHEWLREKLIKWKYKRNVFTWKRKLHRKSTTELNKQEFSEYLKDIDKYLWQTFEISVLKPTELWLQYN